MGTVSFTPPTDGSTAEAADVVTPLNTIYDEFNGNIDNANIKANAGIPGSKLADASIDLGAKASAWDGWIAVSDSWTYASATTITVPSDATTKYSVGDKIKFSQSGTKYFYITSVSSTTLTVNGGTDYTVANAAISGIYFSKAETPLGFPQSFNWTPTWTNLTVGSAVQASTFSIHGKNVFFTVSIKLSSSTMGTAPKCTYPVTPKNINAGGVTTTYSAQLGTILVKDDNVGNTFFGLIFFVDTTNMQFNMYNAAASASMSATDITSSVPMTWANSDTLIGMGRYDLP